MEIIKRLRRVARRFLGLKSPAETELHRMLNWKLLAGSHEWPGTHGGTCINEAAIVAAGFPYRAVETVEDCPPCFSPVLAAFLIGLNDEMGDEDRQVLLPFVNRLPSSSDDEYIEVRRLRHIANAACEVAFGLQTLDDVRRKFGWDAVIGKDIDWAWSVLAKHPEKAVAVLDVAFSMGNQASQIEIGLVKQRMTAIRAERELASVR